MALSPLVVPCWRTGACEHAPLVIPPNRVADSARMVRTEPERVWIDTDAACGEGNADPDDCFAILALARSRGIAVVGIATVFGNAPLPATDRIARALAAQLGGVPVHRGAAAPGADEITPAQDELQRTLADGPLTIVALGPLTNIAAALADRPDLQANVTRLIAVMGRREGHVFHPSEGETHGVMFGHGPVFRDFNVIQDVGAVLALLRMDLRVTLVPYELARRVEIAGADLDRMQAAGGTASWIAARSRAWLAWWRAEVGRDGFYPFDLLAAAYAIDSRPFSCGVVALRIAHEWSILGAQEGLFIGPAAARAADAPARGGALYCTAVEPGLRERLLRVLGDGQA